VVVASFASFAEMARVTVHDGSQRSGQVFNQSISLFASKYTYMNVISVNGRSPGKQLAGDL